MALIATFVSYIQTFEQLIMFLYKKEKEQLKPLRGFLKQT